MDSLWIGGAALWTIPSESVQKVVGDTPGGYRETSLTSKNGEVGVVHGRKFGR